MKLLHILRSEPDELVRQLIRKMAAAGESHELAIHREPVDYDRLVQLIFQSDRVICWW
jgi:hypothetical protein